jgi:hypothetical protein
MSTIGERIGLATLVVDSRPRGRVESPAKAIFGSDRALRDEPDFSVVQGTMRGQGTLAQAMSVLAMIEAQSWPKRVLSVSVEPSSAGPGGGGPVAITLSLETLYFEDLPVRPPRDEPAIAAIDPGRAALVARLVTKNVFERPAAPASALAIAPAPDPGPTAPSSAEWVVTGWAEGGRGWELWVRNRRDQETRSVALGQKLLDATFVEVRDGFAVVQVGEQRFAIELGQSLGSREKRIE